MEAFYTCWFVFETVDCINKPRQGWATHQTPVHDTLTVKHASHLCSPWPVGSATGVTLLPLLFSSGVTTWLLLAARLTFRAVNSGLWVAAASWWLLWWYATCNQLIASVGESGKKSFPCDEFLHMTVFVMLCYDWWSEIKPRNYFEKRTNKLQICEWDVRNIVNYHLMSFMHLLALLLVKEVVFIVYTVSIPALSYFLLICHFLPFKLQPQQFQFELAS